MKCKAMKRRNNKNRDFIVLNKKTKRVQAINNGNSASRVDSIKTLIMFYCSDFTVNGKMSESSGMNREGRKYNEM